MLQIPKCEVNGCENGGMVIYLGKLICGSCLMKIYNEGAKEFWKNYRSEDE